MGRCWCWIGIRLGRGRGSVGGRGWFGAFVGDYDETRSISAGEVLGKYWRLELNSLWCIWTNDTFAWVGVTIYTGVVVYVFVAHEMRSV